MCTCLIAGRNASLSGRAMLAANDDWDNVPGVLCHVPAAVHAAGETRVLTGGQAIPQPAQTWGYSYTACVYDVGTLDKAWAFGVNDRGVAVAGTGASAFKHVPCGGAKLEADDILFLMLERAASARDGIRLIGALTAQYGMRPAGLAECQSMATYAVADKDEGWFLEMAPGNHWIAVRVPDDEVGVRVNAFAVHDADLTDTENVMASEGLADYARAQGWWDGDDRHFDFAAAYGAEESPNEWGPELDAMNMRRRWRAMCLISGGERDEAALEYSARPARKLSLSDLTAILRDTYENTVYDLRRAPEAGRYENPFHDHAASYALCRHATVTSIAADFSRENAPVLWAAMSTPAVCAYIPLWADVDGLPPVCGGDEPDEPSLYWEWKELSILTQRRYAPNSELVCPAIAAYERRMTERLDEDARRIAVLPENERRAARTKAAAEYIDEARALCQKLRAELLKRY